MRPLVLVLVPYLIRYLLWVLIAALPMQGQAAILASCARGVVPAQMVEQHGTEQHGIEHGVEKNIGDTATPAPSLARQDQCDEHAPHMGASHGKCAHAACCCSVVVAPGFIARVAPVSHSSAAVASIEPAMTAHIPTALERPPRHFS